MRFPAFGLFAAFVLLAQVGFATAADPAEDTNSLVRFKLTMDEFGNCIIAVQSTDNSIEKATEFEGDVVKLARLPRTTALRNTDGLTRFQHDFEKPDSLDELTMQAIAGGHSKVELDQQSGVLRLNSKSGEAVFFAYHSRMKLPVTVAFDVAPMPEFTATRIILAFGGGYERLVASIYTEDQAPGLFHVASAWIDGKSHRRTQILPPVLFDIKRGTKQRFRPPIPNAKFPLPCFLTLRGESRGESAQEISRLIVQGKIVPTFGIGFDQRRGAVFVTQVVKGSLAEQAGVQVGDVVVKVNGETPSDMQQAIGILGNTVIGDTATLEIERAGKVSTVSIRSE